MKITQCALKLVAALRFYNKDPVMPSDVANPL